MHKHLLRTFAAASLACAAIGAQAAVTEHADIGGFRTFQDTTTGRVWADLNNFYGANNQPIYASYQDALTALGNAGFTYASVNDVAALFATLPLVNANSVSFYATIMATTHGTGNLGNYLGGFASEAGQHRDAGAFLGDLFWSFAGAPEAVFPAIAFPNGPLQIGLWAYIAPVPEVGSLAMVAMGLALLAAATRRGQNNSAA